MRLYKLIRLLTWLGLMGLYKLIRSFSLIGGVFPTSRRSERSGEREYYADQELTPIVPDQSVADALQVMKRRCNGGMMILIEQYIYKWNDR